MKQDLILLFGKSGSGKNYIIDTFGLKAVVSNTTRPMRPGETNGVEHNFLAGRDWMCGPKLEYIVAHNKRGAYDYWATEDDLVGKDVYIIDLPGIQMLLSNDYITSKYNFKLVYVKCSLFRRILHMLKRKEGIKSIITRLWIDFWQFKGWKSVNPIVFTL